MTAKTDKSTTNATSDVMTVADASADPIVYPYDIGAALAHLTDNDDRLAAHISTIGPYRLLLRPSYNSFQALLRAIVYQQISGAAADTVFSRIRALTPGARLPTASALARIDDASLQKCGLSGQKLSFIRALIDVAVHNRLPSIRRLQSMTDEQVHDVLIDIRGVGLWTVQVLLIFHLARPDVLPVGDLAIRRGFGKVYGENPLYDKSNVPSPQILRDFGERWSPYRTVASWYLWRAITPVPF